MAGDTKKLPARFYRSATGKEPVRDWLLELPREDRRTIGVDIATVEYGWPVGMPTCRPLGDGLWEVRSELSSNRSARVLFCVAHSCMVLLHRVLKKTRTLPQHDVKLARARQKEVSE